MTELPTRAQIFANFLAPLDSARQSLSEARDWLRSDWQPAGSDLTDAATEARRSTLHAIGEAKNLIDDMKRDLAEAIESLPVDEATNSPRRSGRS
jgi:hypothetical protein